MNSQQIELYQKLQAFSFDQLDAQLPFSKRLARDNRWSLKYTQRVIEEYKKFTFLAVVAGHPVTPSDQVDQVWHLHLTYTRSYWQEFCPKVLQMPLHHEPTRGGSSEHLKFHDWYSRTLESYESFFGEVPPADIWSLPKIRFGQDLHFVRINTQQNWVVPNFAWLLLIKIQPSQLAIFTLLFTFVFVIAGCQAIAGVPNPLNFTGSEFLSFYFQTAVVVIVLAFCLRNLLRLPNGDPMQQSVELDAYETAYLTKIANRLVDTVIVNLVQQEYVTVQSEQRMLVLNRSVEQLSHPVEQAVATAIESNGQIEKVRQIVVQVRDVIRDRLQQFNLLLSQSQSFKAQLYPTLMITALLGLGITKIFVGISRGKPVGYLLILCGLIAVIGFIFFLVPPHRSRYGDRVLENLRSRTRSRLYGNLDPQLPLAFALFGRTILAGDVLADLKKVLIPPPSSDGGGGDSSGGGGCGGGGCGGGGCGGCGG